jgi:hypothetical protein
MALFTEVGKYVTNTMNGVIRPLLSKKFIASEGRNCSANVLDLSTFRLAIWYTVV